jgi:predicted amidohydrolase
MYDLVIKGTVIDPAQGIDSSFDVAFEGGKVAAIASGADRCLELRRIVERGRLWHRPESRAGHA